MKNRAEQGDLLELVATVPLNAVAEFAVEERFGIGNMVGGYPIVFIGTKFRWLFNGLVERDAPATRLMCSRLVREGFDPQIIAALGGANGAPTPLAHIFQLMELGKNGQADDGNNRSYVIPPIGGSLWRVNFYLGHSDASQPMTDEIGAFGWNIGAEPLVPIETTDFKVASMVAWRRRSNHIFGGV